MAILVTGATGFLGQRVVELLADTGEEIVATGRSLARGQALVSDRVRFVPADLRNPAEVRRLFSPEVDRVVHSAALAAPWGRRSAFLTSNVVGTQHLLDAAGRASIRRFVFVSTSSVYARLGHQYAVEERSPLPRRAANGYVESKRKAEARVRRSGLPYIILRPRGLFGPRDTNVLPRLIGALQANRLPIIGPGDNITDLTYIDNAVSAVQRSLVAPPEAIRETYNVTNGEPVKVWETVRDLALALELTPPTRRIPLPAAYLLASALEARARLTPGRPEPLLTRYTVSLLGQSTTLDITKAMRTLGYRPRVSMSDGVAAFVDWFRHRSGSRQTSD
ncbi:MAG: NAD(P)-dependent oxidoreductase [Myxococcota bacterium]